MGLYDREYSRSPYDARPPMAPGQSMVVTIIVINLTVFFANVFFGGPNNALMYGLAANVYSLVYPWLWWQLLTAGFAHDPQGINHILFNMLGLWFLGREVERALGRWEFLRFYLIAIVIGNVVQNLIFLAMFDRTEWPPPYQFGAAGGLGASGGVTAVVMLFIFYFPRAQLLLFFVIPVRAWVLGVAIVAIDVLGSAGIYLPLHPEPARVGYNVHLAGAAFALLYHFAGLNFGRMVPSRLGAALGGLGGAMRRRPKLRVHAPTDEPTDEKHRRQDEEADRILAKLNREGMDSLTAKERRILEDYSRRMRQKHR